ncbi:MAG: hypothetical protein IPH94_15200 [Saprospiraceae bacterium]|nr:hypothetical protein [Saprospiraceae bacterium]MBK8112886.1 hypothetical protein [Saprospiraceae bacterium]MBK8852448.1 hypothetical protein [Saprospiraceae bacterium]MBK9689295.1 hypothetical protein [Saprospiraceae bacterium]
MRATWSSIYHEVFIQKKENALSDWRTTMDELLATHQVYSTQPDDIKRLILGLPIMSDYVQVPTIVGDQKEKDGK